MSENNTKDLFVDQLCANMSMESLIALQERCEGEMKRKEVLKNYSLKQLPKGDWYVIINRKKHQYKRKEDLENYIVEYSRQQEENISNIYDKYLKRRKTKVAETTWCLDISNYERFIKTSEISRIPLKQLKSKDGYEFFYHCKKIKPDMKRKYWNKISCTLLSIFKFAIEEEIITENPFKDMELGKDQFVSKQQIREEDTVFSKAEQSLICTMAKEKADETKHSEPLGILILFNLGLRIGELCALKWMDIEPIHDKMYIHIQREMVPIVDDKGHKSGHKVLEHCKTKASDRKLILSPTTINLFSLIKKYNEQQEIPTSDTDYIFMRWIDGRLQLCTPMCFDSRLRRYCRKNGIIEKSPHDIRRTTLTNLYYLGMPLKDIQKFAGHTTLKQTMEYIRVQSLDEEIIPFLEQIAVG